MSQIAIVNRMKSFHVKSRHHIFNKNIVNNDLCDCGDTIHDIDNLIWQCSMYTDARTEFIEWCNEKQIKNSDNICKITNNSLGLYIA